MLSEVRATSVQGSLLSLPFGEITSGLYIKDIEGLEPVKANIVSTSFPNKNGEVYMASQREARDIKLKLGIEPDYIAEEPKDVRRRLYQFFMSNTMVDLKFIDTDGLVVDISGMIETFDSPLFVQEPGAEISIHCFNSDFVDLDNQIEIMGNSVSNTLDTTINYEGSVEAGIEFYLIVNRDVDEFSIYNTLPNGQIRQLDFAWPLHNGDQVNFITTPGNKRIELVRAGVTSSLLYAMSPQSSWIDFYPGTNLFRVYAEGDPIQYLLYYNNRYGGL
jgi:hypothetical protein